MPTIAKKKAKKRAISAAEELWSAKERGLLSFETIPPILSGKPSMPVGGVGVAPGLKGTAAFYSYIGREKVVARLKAEGFEEASSKSPHRFFLVMAPGVVSPANKALCRALTAEQREKIDRKRLSALKRKRVV